MGSLAKTDAETGIAVIGLGYVGCVTAACLAELGHRVVGVDRDEFKVKAVLAGQAPFFEPGLEELIRANVAAGRLRASTRLNEALEQAEDRPDLRGDALGAQREPQPGTIAAGGG